MEQLKLLQRRAGDLLQLWCTGGLQRAVEPRGHMSGAVTHP